MNGGFIRIVGALLKKLFVSVVSLLRLAQGHEFIGESECEPEPLLGGRVKLERLLVFVGGGGRFALSGIKIAKLLGQDGTLFSCGKPVATQSATGLPLARLISINRKKHHSVSLLWR